MVGAHPSRPRLVWVDGARGVAVILVVLLHVTIGSWYLQPWVSHPVTGEWDRINQILSLVRLPLLFAVSGFLASSRVREGLTLRTMKSAVSNYWTYLVWLLLFGGFILALPKSYPAPHRVASWDLWAEQVVLPNTYLWYVGAIAVMLLFLALLSTLRVPPAAVLMGALGLHLWASCVWGAEAPLWTRGVVYLLFFALGAHGRRVLKGLLELPSTPPLYPLGILGPLAPGGATSP